MSGEAIEIEYQLTVDDLVAFNLFTFMGQETDSIRAIASQLRGLAVVFLLLTVSFFVTPDRGKSFVAFFAFVLLFFFFISIIKQKSVRRTVKNLLSRGTNQLLFTSRKYYFDQNLIRETTKHSDYKLEWAGVEKVEKAQAYIFIYLTTLSAFIIPKRAFRDEAAFERFYEKCQAYYNAAREKPVAAEGAA